MVGIGSRYRSGLLNSPISFWYVRQVTESLATSITDKFRTAPDRFTAAWLMSAAAAVTTAVAIYATVGVAVASGVAVGVGVALTVFGAVTICFAVTVFVALTVWVAEVITITVAVGPVKKSVLTHWISMRALLLIVIVNSNVTSSFKLKVLN